MADIPIATLLIVAAIGAATIRRRFSAALFLGAAGYAMAGLFVAYGAPDLALTQVAVETLSTVVVRARAAAAARPVRAAVDARADASSASRSPASVGAMVFVFAIAAARVDSHDRLCPTRW